MGPAMSEVLRKLGHGLQWASFLGVGMVRPHSIGHWIQDSLQATSFAQGLCCCETDPLVAATGDSVLAKPCLPQQGSGPSLNMFGPVPRKSHI